MNAAFLATCRIAAGTVGLVGRAAEQRDLASAQRPV